MKKLFIPILAIIAAASCGSKEKPITPIEPPSMVISSIAPFEGDAQTTVSLKVNLSRATDQIVTVDFATADGTAGAGADYVAKTGTLIFKPQTTEGVIDINVIGDTLREADETFLVTLSKATNATIATETGTATIRNDDTYIFIPSDGYTTPENYTGYAQEWRDEFNGTALDLTNWGFDVGGGGWGNNELQYYTNNRPDNIYLDNGKLIIQAKKEAFSGREYTSSRILTKGKREFTFGRIDIRAKLPVAKGLWPALWMLGKKIDQTSWPACGEIDIMELVGKEPNKVHGTLHWANSAGSRALYGTSYTLPTGTFADKFHVFTAIWEADKVEILMDDISYYKFDKSKVGGAAYPFNEPFFLIFNVAVGGDWPGLPDATTTFPQQMVVDYVRVFKKL
ncbi:MAG: family 16 glycosylhydrolase [Saprospiraceae bacterium]|nr:family 16 glycosylhydrolase [Saprospiraceae bacterium]